MCASAFSHLFLWSARELPLVWANMSNSSSSPARQEVNTTTLATFYETSDISSSSLQRSWRSYAKLAHCGLVIFSDWLLWCWLPVGWLLWWQQAGREVKAEGWHPRSLSLQWSSERVRMLKEIIIIMKKNKTKQFNDFTYSYLWSICHLRFVQSVEPETQLYNDKWKIMITNEAKEPWCGFYSIPLVADERIV